MSTRPYEPPPHSHPSSKGFAPSSPFTTHFHYIPLPPPLAIRTIASPNAVCPCPTRIKALAQNRRFSLSVDGQDDTSQDQSHPQTPNLSPSPTTSPEQPTLVSPQSTTLIRRTNSNPSIPSLPLTQPPLRRRLSASPPPSRLQTISEPLLRRQGSGADLSPIDECRASECDGKRKIRLEREKQQADALQAQTDGESGDGFSTAEQKDDGHTPATPKAKRQVKTGGHKSCPDRVFDDPFCAAVVLLTLPFLPPMAVYLTFRECGGMNRHRVREVVFCVVLTVLGWVPGVVYALAVYFKHLPRPTDVQERQADSLSLYQRGEKTGGKDSGRG